MEIQMEKIVFDKNEHSLPSVHNSSPHESVSILFLTYLSLKNGSVQRAHVTLSEMTKSCTLVILLLEELINYDTEQVGIEQSKLAGNTCSPPLSQREKHVLYFLLVSGFYR